MKLDVFSWKVWITSLKGPEIITASIKPSEGPQFSGKLDTVCGRN